MFKNKLANYETYSKTFDGYDLASSYSCYEVYIEPSRDKEGNILKNKDGSDKYHPLDDNLITILKEPIQVKQIRDFYYKDVFSVNGDIVEKIERDGKRFYFVVDASKVTTLEVGTKVVAKNGTYRVPNEIGYVLVDDRIIEQPKIVAVRKFKTDDHKTEAEQLVRRHHIKVNKEENK